MDARLDELFTLWAKWNKKELTGEMFAYRFGNLFKKESRRRFRREIGSAKHHQAFIKRVKTEMVPG